MHFHALGDRAVRQALDAVAAARARNGRPPAGEPDGPAGGRHHLAHLQVVHPDFAIVDADLATARPGEICQASVRQTWVRGQVAYSSS